MRNQRPAIVSVLGALILVVENSHTFGGQASNRDEIRRSSNSKRMEGTLQNAEWAPLLRRKLSFSSQNYGSLLTWPCWSTVDPSYDIPQKL